jgi:hypothetical protein
MFGRGRTQASHTMVQVSTHPETNQTRRCLTEKPSTIAVLIGDEMFGPV